MSNKNRGVLSFLNEHAKKNSISFHMPGHKAGRIYKRFAYSGLLEDVAGMDITEIDGADNLFQPEGIIQETMEKYKDLYGSKSSHLLVNGSSCGLIAAILTVCDDGDEILIARNSHKSIFAALTLGKLTPFYIHPDIIDEWDIAGQISPYEVGKILDKNKNIKAVILPSPNYYGILSPVREIAKEVHKSGRVLIVDQAHGAHLKFFDDVAEKGKSETGQLSIFGRSAESQGADIIINSVHKTLASFTQSAIANVMTDRVNNNKFMEKLQLVQSTSPSYLLMASLDLNAEILMEHKDSIIMEWKSNLEYFYTEVMKIDGVKCMINPELDDTKINISLVEHGICGREFSKSLIERNIYPEMVTGDIVTFMTGIGNERSDYIALLDLICKITTSNENAKTKISNEVNRTIPNKDLSRKEGSIESPKENLKPLSKRLELKQIPQNTEKIFLKDAAGRICASMVTPYPPGIPAICPGEVYSIECVDYLIELRMSGYNILGIDDEYKVSVGLNI